jgi:hypothetical protein
MQCVRSHTPFTKRSIYKPGGTGIQDVIGRWTGVTLTFADLQIVTILLVYQPPKHQQTQGTTNVIVQQTRWFLDKKHQGYHQAMLLLRPQQVNIQSYPTKTYNYSGPVSH